MKKPFEELIIIGTDIETTGLKWDDEKNPHKIIEICNNIYRGKNFLKSVTQRIDPERNIDKKAFEVHNISLQDLEGKPKFKEYAPTLKKLWSKADIIVAHNGADFDFPFVWHQLEEAGHMISGVTDSGVVTDFFDTMKQGRWATGSGKYPSLGELAYACDVEYDPMKAHAAKYDVDVMMESFFNGLEYGGFTI